MTCRLLHTLERPDEDPYSDPDVKDVLGKLPAFLCTRHDPLLPLTPSDAVKCLQREEPCWKSTARGNPTGGMDRG